MSRPKAGPGPEHELAARGARLLAQVRELLSPLRTRGRGAKAEEWDAPIRELLAVRPPPTEPEALARWRSACQAWEEAERVWWELAQYRTADILHVESWRALRAVGSRYRQEDLEQAGRLGCYRAAQSWDPNRSGGAAWRTYASRGIRQRIWLHVRDGQTQYVRVSGAGQTAMHRLGQVRRQLELEGIGLSPEDVAALADVEPEMARNLADATRIVHLDAPVAPVGRGGAGEGEMDRHELVGGSSPDWDEDIDHERQLEELRQAIASLPKRLRVVIEARLEGATLRGAGRAVGGLSGERVRQLEQDALKLICAELGRPVPQQPWGGRGLHPQDPKIPRSKRRGAA